MQPNLQRFRLYGDLTLNYAHTIDLLFVLEFDFVLNNEE